MSIRTIFLILLVTANYLTKIYSMEPKLYAQNVIEHLFTTGQFDKLEQILAHYTYHHPQTCSSDRLRTAIVHHVENILLSYPKNQQKAVASQWLSVLAHAPNLKMLLHMVYARVRAQSLTNDIPFCQFVLCDGITNYQHATSSFEMNSDLWPELNRELEHILASVESVLHRPVSALNLAGTTLTKLPESIGVLTNLTTVLLMNTSVSVLPKNFKRLEKLFFLCLKNNRFKEVPQVIRCLKNLEILGLSHNPISSLPEWLSELPNLKFIELHKNHKVFIPKCLKEKVLIDDW